MLFLVLLPTGMGAGGPYEELMLLEIPVVLIKRIVIGE